jgi:hypothetical protein
MVRDGLEFGVWSFGFWVWQLPNSNELYISSVKYNRAFLAELIIKF